MNSSQTKILHPEFISNIQDGIITITSNLRLVSLLNKQAAAGLKTWATYPIYTLEQFVVLSLEQAVFAGNYPADKYSSMVLEPLEQQLIWEDIIGKTEADSPLSNFNEIAKYTKQAWQYLQQWDLLPQDITGGFEFNKLKLWIKEYQSLSKEHNFTGQITLFKNLSDFNQHTQIIHAPQIQFAGFKDKTPLFKKFISGLENNGTKISWLENPKIANSILRVEADGLKSEVDSMANWCQTTLQNKPDSKIAIVVPELVKYREQIIKSLDQHLQTEKYGLDDIDSSDIYNVSLGDSLLDHNIVGSALGMLEILTSKLDVDYQLVSTIFNSRNFSPDAISAKAQFDCYFREHAKTQTSLKQVCDLIKIKYPTNMPEWAQALIKLNTLKDKNSDKKSCADWAEIFSDYLAIARFATREDKSYTEHQILKSLQKAFASFAVLRTNKNLVSANAAFSLLKKICADKIFQAETSHTVNIEVMGIPEVIDQVFDYLWFMGANTNSLPNPTRPNPLLPLSLQKKLKIPAACAEMQLRQAKKIIKRIKTNAKDIIFSSAKIVDSKEVLASRLIEQFPIKDALLVEVANSKPEKLEHIKDYSGSKKPTGKLKSAIKFIQDQAICPLMAYAIHRLGAKHPEVPAGALSPLIRGQIIHHALENIYAKFDKHDALSNLSDEILKKIIFHSVKTQENKSSILGKNTLALELARVQLMITHWLSIDKARDDFQVVARELPINLNLNDFEFNLRIDRVDKLADESFAIIDYKTGQTNKAGWFDERLTEPQLPLYAICRNQTNAIVFAEIKPTDAKLKYLGTTEIIKAQKSLISIEEWQQQLEKWQQQLDILTQEIKNGLAVLDVENHLSIIASDASGFCRIHEQL